MLKFFKNKWVRLFLLLALFAVVAITLTVFLGTSCVFSLITGFPCPACGMTRANLLALHFKFGEAFAMHPLFFFSVPAFALVVLITAKPSFAMKRWVTVTAIVLALALITTYIVRMVLFYGKVVPMVYNYNSLLGLIIRLFQT